VNLKRENGPRNLCGLKKKNEKKVWGGSRNMGRRKIWEGGEPDSEVPGGRKKRREVVSFRKMGGVLPSVFENPEKRKVHSSIGGGKKASR